MLRHRRADRRRRPDRPDARRDAGGRAASRDTSSTALAAGANTSRAAVVNARTLEVLEELGVARRLVAAGLQAQRFTIRDRDRVLIADRLRRPADRATPTR